MRPQYSEPHLVLQAIVARLDPLLRPHGFRFHTESNASSSGGLYENGFYRRGLVRIGLIVRGNKLGAPNYFWLNFLTGHNELIQRLGRANESVLRVYEPIGNYHLSTTDGRDVVDGLIADVENIILPAIVKHLHYTDAPSSMRITLEWRSGAFAQASRVDSSPGSAELNVG